jgi:ribosomal protein S18 acetylase RimI-like enzyme
MLKAVNEAGAIVACVYLQQTDQKLYLGMLTVSPELQNKGVGKQLLQQAEQVAKERNCSHISMTVISVRKELIAWYERHGYRATSERKPFVVGEHIGNPLHPLEFIVLEKWL